MTADVRPIRPANETERARAALAEARDRLEVAQLALQIANERVQVARREFASAMRYCTRIEANQ